MNDLIIEMENWIKLYYGDKHFLIIALCSYIYLLIFEKELRKKLVYPCLIITFLLLNPYLYKVIYEGGRYWRFLWLLPNSMVTAIAITKLVERVRYIWLKVLIVISCMAIIVFFGTNVYENGVFTKTQNEYKISEDTVKVCDIILADNNKPKCILPFSLYSEARQYNSNIILYYGRNANGFISSVSDEQRRVYMALNSKDRDYDYAFMVGKNENCNYIVVENDEVSEEVLYNYGFIRFESYADYIIYKNIN